MMKKLTKFYHSTDTKLANYQLGDYGSFEKILKDIICGNGFNEISISSFEVLANKTVKFTFSTPDDNVYNLKKFEVVNIKGINKEEYVIVDIQKEYILCEYYEDYNIQTNFDFIGSIVSSSFGFKEVEKNPNTGRYTIINEEENVYYNFYDTVSTSFTNSIANKVIGVYMQSKEDPSLVVPNNRTAIDYNNLPEWETNTTPKYKRRCLHNIFYANNSKYAIIGNGNFVFFIVSYPSNYTYRRSNIYAFGKFKTYLEGNKYNHLLVAGDIYNGTSNTNAVGSEIGINRSSGGTYRFGMLASHISPNYSSIYASNNSVNNNYANTMTNNGISPSPNQIDLLSDHCFNANLLYGYNGISSFHITPKAYIGTTGLLYQYPNYDNKMITSQTNISMWSSGHTYMYNIGVMPFMLVWGHAISSIPYAEKTFIIRDDNGDSNLVFAHNGDSATTYGSGAWLFDITPKNYILYNNYDS